MKYKLAYNRLHLGKASRYINSNNTFLEEGITENELDAFILDQVIGDDNKIRTQFHSGIAFIPEPVDDYIYVHIYVLPEFRDDYQDEDFSISEITIKEDEKEEEVVIH